MNGQYSQWRALLVLGRASNLPTVWSNCCAAWLLGGGGIFWGGAKLGLPVQWPRFALLCAGATLLYTGGMYLNDAFDAAFDAQHRRERPIPSGAIVVKAVWQLGILFLVLGLLLLLPLGAMPALTGLLLCGCIVAYDAIHKRVAFAPVLMALCRFFLYLVAASAATGVVTGMAVWAALVLALYVTGLSYVARKESTGVTVQLWPLLLLAAPLVLAALINDGKHRQMILPVAAVLVLWTVRSLRSVVGEVKNIPRTVSGLLAGIVWVDLLAVVDIPREQGAVFVVLFLLALVFQRFVPAT